MDTHSHLRLKSITPELVYQYDGTLDGWLCCVYESYQKREIPASVISAAGPMGAASNSLFPPKIIQTDLQSARRVKEGICNRIGADFWQILRQAFFTCLKNKEELMLLLTRKGFSYGDKVLLLTEDPVVQQINKSLRFLGTEIDKWRGFVRFTEIQGVLIAVIGAKNCVLPFIAPHFCRRFHQEHFIIYDENHQMALVYRPGERAIVPLERFFPGEIGAEEERYKMMWRAYYDSIEIKPRHNERCRRTHMPQWYWAYLTEMAQDTKPKERKPQEKKPGERNLGEKSRPPQEKLRPVP